MSRGIRSNTLDRILIARERDPLAIGPLVGELAVRRDVPASLIAEMVGANEQTVGRWLFGQSEIQAYWLPKVMQLLGVLAYMRLVDTDPLRGEAAEKRDQMRKAVLAFKAAAKSTSRTIRSAA